MDICHAVKELKITFSKIKFSRSQLWHKVNQKRTCPWKRKNLQKFQIDNLIWEISWMGHTSVILIVKGDIGNQAWMNSNSRIWWASNCINQKVRKPFYNKLPSIDQQTWQRSKRRNRHQLKTREHGPKWVSIAWWIVDPSHLTRCLILWTSEPLIYKRWRLWRKWTTISTQLMELHLI